ncbi:MAG TPA: ATP-binding protein [Gemmataceae bacterium]|nr:ATP-binding protein [Gemmataceae bacterium]
MSSPNPSDADRAPGLLFTARLSPDGTFTFDSPDWATFAESTPDELSAALTAGRLPQLPDDGPELWDSIRRSAADLTPWRREMRMIGPKSGRERWVWVQSFPAREPDGAVVWNGLAVDVTELRATQDSLARSDSRLRAALHSARMLGWDWDMAAQRATFSGDFAEFFGVPSGPDYGDVANTWAAVHPDDIETVTAARQAALDHTGEMVYEFRGRIPDRAGRVRWFATRGQFLRDRAGTPVRVVAVTADVSDWKRAEAGQEEMARRLIDAQKWESLGVLAGGVAHDFNNILTVVLGSAGLARKSLPPAAPARAHLDQIETACRRAADLCRQMLAYSGRGPVTAGRADLNALIRDSAALLSVPASKNAALLFELQPDLPAIPADAGQVRQVLVNLVMNAAEALGDSPGEVRVRTSLAEVRGTELDPSYRLTPSPGRYVCLSVTDTGPGIPTDVRARMFDPFFSTKFAGRGLGLAAVLGFVRSHNGAIRVETEMGVGTTIHVLWPIELRPSTSPHHAAAATPQRESAGHALVIDDEMFVREVAASTLEELGYEPLLAADGVTGVEVYRQRWRTVKVAVIDVMMPKMNGDRVLEAIRAMDPSLPAVVMSGYTDRRSIRAAAGTRTEFLQKPFLPEELANAVRRVVSAPG